ncbi:MAG: hypothetical protein Q9194_003724 [Teloschistes cf. exilis]
MPTQSSSLSDEKSTFEEEVDENVYVRDSENANGDPDGPNVTFLGRNQPKEEKSYRESNKEYREQIGWLGGPKPFERLGNVVLGYIEDMSPQTQAVCVDQEGICHDGHELSWD